MRMMASHCTELFLVLIFTLPGLVHLQCSAIDTNNTIQHLNKSYLKNCEATSTLNLSNRGITSIANDTFEEMWDLTDIDLSFNSLASLPDGVFGSNRILRWLNISYNQISELPIMMFKNKDNLQMADLSHNIIEYIPSTVFNHSLNDLRLNLSHNLLQAVEPWAFIYDIKRPMLLVDLKYNNISKFTNEYNFTYNGRRVYDQALTDLRYNSFTSWNDSYFFQYRPSGSTVSQIYRQLEFDVRNNEWICDCNMHNLASKIQTSFYKFTIDTRDLTCASPPQLKDKYIIKDVQLWEFVCNITDGCPAECFCEEQPEKERLIVNCRDAGLTEMPHTLPLRDPYKHIALNLDRNNITLIHKTNYTENIESLSLQNNLVSNITKEALNDMRKNVSLDLRNNLITAVPSLITNKFFKNVRLEGNRLRCSCDIVPSMLEWISAADQEYADRKNLPCWTDGGEELKIRELNYDILECINKDNIFLVVILSVVVFLIGVVIVVANRCPYETKVLVYKFFRIHPADKYEVDKCTDKQYDMAVSFDEQDPYVCQWVKKVLVKQIENKKPFFKLGIGSRISMLGQEAEARLDLLDASRRVLIILSSGYGENEWCQYEMYQTDRLDHKQDKGRVVFLLYDDEADKMALQEPWLSKMEGRKRFTVGERFFWDKLRYELPRKSVRSGPPDTLELYDIATDA